MDKREPHVNDSVQKYVAMGFLLLPEPQGFLLALGASALRAAWILHFTPGVLGFALLNSNSNVMQ